MPVGKTDRTSGRRGQRRGYGARRAARDRVAASEGSGRDGRRGSGRDGRGVGRDGRVVETRQARVRGSPRHIPSRLATPLPSSQSDPRAAARAPRHPGLGRWHAGRRSRNPSATDARDDREAPRARAARSPPLRTRRVPLRRSQTEIASLGPRPCRNTHLTETVLEAAGKGLEVAHATSSGGATADSLRGPVV